MSSKNRFYSLFNGRFFEFDANRRNFTFTKEAQGRFAMSITEGPEGRIWAATYPESHLVSFDPETREFIEYGQVNEESWPQYPRAIAADHSGWVYIGIGTTESQIIAFNPTTGTRRRVARQEQQRTGRPPVWRGTDGKAYGRPYPEGPWYEFFNGQARRISEPPVKQEPIMHGSQSALLRNFPAGWQLEEINLPGKWALIQKPGQDEAERIRFDYETDGSHIMSLAQGPDNLLYGSTGHPLRVYTFDPATEDFTHRGLMGLNGHLNALDVVDGLLYMGLYARGGLLAYNPTERWRTDTQTNPNPELLFFATPTIHRPHAVVAHPDGRYVLMGGTPDYGRTGGGLAIYDRQENTHTLVTHEELIPYHSPYAMAGLPGSQVLVGTTIRAGTGGEPRAEEAQLYLFDLAQQKITYRELVVAGAREITDLLLSSDADRVFGLAEREDGVVFFAFDPSTQTVIHREALASYGDIAGVQGSRVLVQGPDDTIYVLFREAIVAIDHDSYEHRKLTTLPVQAGAGFVLRDGRLYFAGDSHLWSYRIPPTEGSN